MTFWIGLFLLVLPALTAVAVMVGLHYWLRYHYLDVLLAIFEERPLFIVPRGEPIDGAEDVTFPTTGGLCLRGCYLKGQGPRKGVILFGGEFGSDRWACRHYCQGLLEAGYDVFSFEPRNQGQSDRDAGYEPLQWVTDRDVDDLRAALTYLKSRPDADPRGVGLFGISKGGSTGLQVAAQDASVRCFVVDGVYATYTTMVPYMRKWVSIYNDRYVIQGLLPFWYYGLIALAAIRKANRRRRVRFQSLEPALTRLGSRPLLMIHGGGDTYIKPPMAEALFAYVRGPKSFWLIDGAKHNQALHVAGAEYHRRVREFFDRHLAAVPAEPASQDEPPSSGGSSCSAASSVPAWSN